MKWRDLHKIPAFLLFCMLHSLSDFSTSDVHQSLLQRT